MARVCPIFIPESAQGDDGDGVNAFEQPRDREPRLSGSEQQGREQNNVGKYAPRVVREFFGLHRASA